VSWPSGHLLRNQLWFFFHLACPGDLAIGATPSPFAWRRRCWVHRGDRRNTPEELATALIKEEGSNFLVTGRQPPGWLRGMLVATNKPFLISLNDPGSQPGIWFPVAV